MYSSCFSYFSTWDWSKLFSSERVLNLFCRFRFISRFLLSCSSFSEISSNKLLSRVWERIEACLKFCIRSWIFSFVDLVFSLSAFIWDDCN